MLPQSHAFFALGMVRILQKRYPRLAGVDYRKVAFAAVLPDLIDKPLAVFVFPQLKAGLLFAHAPLFHLALLWLTRKHDHAFSYALSFASHIVGDRIWFFGDTFWFPLRGFRFHQWRDIGDPKSFTRAYRDLFRHRPGLFAYEIVALCVLAGFVRSARLTERQALSTFLRTGKLT